MIFVDCVTSCVSAFAWCSWDSGTMSRIVAWSAGAKNVATLVLRKTRISSTGRLGATMRHATSAARARSEPIITRFFGQRSTHTPANGATKIHGIAIAIDSAASADGPISHT